MGSLRYTHAASGERISVNDRRYKLLRAIAITRAHVAQNAITQRQDY